MPRASEREERRRRTEARLYGRERGEIVVRTPASIRDYWVGYLRETVRADRDAVVLYVGKAGSGKSTGIMDLAWRIDPTFTPETMEQRVAFRPRHVATIYSTVPRYGVGWIDEAVSSGLMATDHFSADQKDLVELINNIRAKNAVLFVALPHLSDLALSFRARRADLRIEVTPKDETDSGEPEAHVGRRPSGRQFFREDEKWFGFMDDPDENPLRWDEYRGSSDPWARALWDAYYPLKMRYLDKTVERIGDRMDARERAREKKMRRAD